MPEFIVTMTAQGTLTASINLNAPTRKAAEKYAMAAARAGEVIWGYDAADDDTIKISKTAFNARE